MKTTSKGNFIDGTWKQGGGRYFTSIDPSSEKEIWTGNISSNDDISFAIDAAHNALPKWAALKAEERANYIERFAELVKSKKTEIANLISQEVGKPKWEALTEVEAVIGKWAPTLEAYKSRASTLVRQQGGIQSTTRFFPHGVAVVISPINFPIHMANGHIMPALLAGNTVIWKPSEFCPMTAEKLIEIWNEANLPHGVINLVHGYKEAVQKLIKSNKIDAVMFTGSKKAGLAISSALADEPWKLYALEMGGNNPLVVWDYSDIRTALFITIQSCFITSGQRCSSARRLIVRRSDTKFLEALIAAVKKLRVSTPDTEPQPYMGTMVSRTHAEVLLEIQERIIANGGKPLVKANLIKPLSALVSPGIINVTNLVKRENEEVFGPLVQLIEVDSFEEALSEANNTCYGLSAGLVSTSKQLFEKFLVEVKAGVINWNQQLTGATSFAPFGGIKQSGNKRPSGYFAVDYCSYPTATMEIEEPQLPSTLPMGMDL